MYVIIWTTTSGRSSCHRQISLILSLLLILANWRILWILILADGHLTEKLSHLLLSNFHGNYVALFCLSRTTNTKYKRQNTKYKIHHPTTISLRREAESPLTLRNKLLNFHGNCVALIDFVCHKYKIQNTKYKIQSKPSNGPLSRRWFSYSQKQTPQLPW